MSALSNGAHADRQGGGKAEQNARFVRGYVDEREEEAQQVTRESKVSVRFFAIARFDNRLDCLPLKCFITDNNFQIRLHN